MRVFYSLLLRYDTTQLWSVEDPESQVLNPPEIIKKKDSVEPVIRTNFEPARIPVRRSVALEYARPVSNGFYLKSDARGERVMISLGDTVPGQTEQDKFYVRCMYFIREVNKNAPKGIESRFEFHRTDEADSVET